MIDEDIRHIIEREMDDKETLIWAEKSNGNLINRYATIVLLLNSLVAAWIFFYLKSRNGSDIIFFYFIFLVALFNILKFLRIMFSPRFETYGLSSDYLYIVRFLIFRSVRKFPINVKTYTHSADWSGPNDVIVHWKDLQKGIMYISFDLKLVVLHGLSEPRTFIDILDDVATTI